MPRVKCPHCGAGNQDATEDDTCWQCGRVLGAPVTRPATEVVAPTSTPTRVLDPSRIHELARASPSGRQQTPPSPRLLATWGPVLVVLLLAVLMILLFLFLSRP
ncbi:MAG: hypothetical protein RMJ43_10320 [Chloroherpetonaceae bacterium]|nr:hypothetical protein [Chthonomonadaceae bacterium]MDW8208223.1 hypothetical protein [Chloroherpetonaceae bacterium]